LPELPCKRRSGPAEPSPGMPKRPEPPPEQELPVPRHSIAKKPLFGPGTAAQSMVCGPGCAVRGAWSVERGWGAWQGGVAGRRGWGESPGFSVRVWPDALLRLPAGEGSRLDLGLGWRGRLRSILSSPRFSGLSGQKNPSRGRVAEWLKAPDSKLFLPLWTALLTLGQKWRFRPISLGFYNFHLDTEGRRKTRFSTGSIQVEYTSGSIQVSPCHPQDTSDFR
jgi:hypothetical protein